VETIGSVAPATLVVLIWESLFPFPPSDTGEGVASAVMVVPPPISEIRFVLAPVHTRQSQGPANVSHDCSDSGVADACTVLSVCSAPPLSVMLPSKASDKIHPPDFRFSCVESKRTTSTG
jgi:hypothetical protein